MAARLTIHFGLTPSDAWALTPHEYWTLCNIRSQDMAASSGESSLTAADIEQGKVEMEAQKRRALSRDLCAQKEA